MAVDSMVMAKSIPGSLVRYLGKDSCVLFAGAGLSVWGGLPIWKDLLQTMVDRFQEDNPTSPYLNEMRELLNVGDFLTVAQHCKEKLGQLNTYEILKEQLVLQRDFVIS